MGLVDSVQHESHRNVNFCSFTKMLHIPVLLLLLLCIFKIVLKFSIADSYQVLQVAVHCIKQDVILTRRPVNNM